MSEALQNNELMIALGSSPILSERNNNTRVEFNKLQQIN